MPYLAEGIRGLSVSIFPKESQLYVPKRFCASGRNATRGVGRVTISPQRATARWQCLQRLMPIGPLRASWLTSVGQSADTPTETTSFASVALPRVDRRGRHSGDVCKNMQMAEWYSCAPRNDRANDEWGFFGAPRRAAPLFRGMERRKYSAEFIERGEMKCQKRK